MCLTRGPGGPSCPEAPGSPCSPWGERKKIVSGEWLKHQIGTFFQILTSTHNRAGDSTQTLRARLSRGPLWSHRSSFPVRSFCSSFSLWNEINHIWSGGAAPGCLICPLCRWGSSSLLWSTGLTLSWRFTISAPMSTTPWSSHKNLYLKVTVSLRDTSDRRDLQHLNTSNVSRFQGLSLIREQISELAERSYRPGCEEDGIKLFWQLIRPGFVWHPPHRLCLHQINSNPPLWIECALVYKCSHGGMCKWGAGDYRWQRKSEATSGICVFLGAIWFDRQFPRAYKKVLPI